MVRRRSPAKILARLKAACCAAPFLVSVALADQPRPALPDGCLPEAGAVGQALEGTLRAAELRAGDGVVYRQIDLHMPEAAALPGDGVRQMRFWAVSDQDPTEDGRPLDFASSWYEMPADGNDNI